MNPSVTFPAVLLGLLLIANLGVSFAVTRSHYYSSSQKLVQVVLVWLVPLVGVLGVGVFLYSQRDNTKFDTRAYPEPSEKDVAYTIHESVQGHEHAP